MSSLNLDDFTDLIERPDGGVRRDAEARRERQVVPPGSLGRLDDLGEWLASAQSAVPVRPLERPRVVLFAGDHKVAELGVSARPRGRRRRAGARGPGGRPARVRARPAPRRAGAGRRHGPGLRAGDAAGRRRAAPGAARRRAHRHRGRPDPGGGRGRLPGRDGGGRRGGRLRYGSGGARRCERGRDHGGGRAGRRAVQGPTRRSSPGGAGWRSTTWPGCASARRSATRCAAPGRCSGTSCSCSRPWAAPTSPR